MPEEVELSSIGAGKDELLAVCSEAMTTRRLRLACKSAGC